MGFGTQTGPMLDYIGRSDLREGGGGKESEVRKVGTWRIKRDMGREKSSLRREVGGMEGRIGGERGREGSHSEGGRERGERGEREEGRREE